ncbi:MAG TPA: DUF6502 family protein [Thiobacillaceae bacterium]|nr:DUF6502 family protein [Thiobacillaceae bacterium]
MDSLPRAFLSTPPALLLAVRRLLRPLARLLMSHGVNYPAFAELAKEVYVSAAAHDFPKDEAVITDSRVSLLSGVHRREVKRLRGEAAGRGLPPAAVSLGGLIVARWCAEARYQDPQRRPKPLPRLASQGGDASFERLVEGVNKDIRPRAVLDEWLRLGVATLDDEDRVRLVEAAFVPANGLEEKAFYFGKNLHDHLAAATHNLLDGRPPFLERSVHYDALSPASVEALRTLSRELAVQTMQEINRRALELQQQDADRPEATQRMTFGVYFYSQDEQEPEGPATP